MSRPKLFIFFAILFASSQAAFARMTGDVAPCFEAMQDSSSLFKLLFPNVTSEKPTDDLEARQFAHEIVYYQSRFNAEIEDEFLRLQAKIPDLTHESFWEDIHRVLWTEIVKHRLDYRGMDALQVRMLLKMAFEKVEQVNLKYAPARS